MILKKLILKSREDPKDFCELTFYFNSKINFIVCNFKIEEHYNELLFKLWELSLKINLNKFSNDTEVDNYIFLSLKNEAIKIYKKNKKNKNIIYDSNNIETYLYNKSLNNLDISNIIFIDLLSDLSNRQKQIIDMKYRLNLSDIEISLILGISRQAVNKNKKKALKILYYTLIDI